MTRLIVWLAARAGRTTKATTSCRLNQLKAALGRRDYTCQDNACRDHRPRPADR